MSVITIQCNLVASEETRRYLWSVMVEKNTPLINELLKRVKQHPDFEKWRRRGKPSKEAVRELCEPLRNDPQFNGQPGRFYTSAIATVQQIYESWMATQLGLQRSLDGKVHWLEVVESDAELVTQSNVDADAIRAKAREILLDIASGCLPQKTQEKKAKASQNKEKPRQGKKQQKEKPEVPQNLVGVLLDFYDETKEVVKRRALIHLLRNDCEVNEKEDAKKLIDKLNNKRAEIERLKERLEGRLPKGRDLTDQDFLEALEIATSIPADDTLSEFLAWENKVIPNLPKLVKAPKSMPYPIYYETNTDFNVWKRNEKGRICFELNGLSNHIFEVYCDRRQLHFFEQFLRDYETKKTGGKQHSTGLFLLRSAQLLWCEDKTRIKKKKVKVQNPLGGKAKKKAEKTKIVEPWNYNYLSLHCAVDTRLLTEEGTQQVREELKEDIAETLERQRTKLSNLSDEQVEEKKNLRQSIQSKESTLSRSSGSFSRPSRIPYSQFSRSNVLVGVCFEFHNLVTVAVVDASQNQVLAYRSTRQLLTNERVEIPEAAEGSAKRVSRRLRYQNYRLLNRHRQRQQRNARQRREDRKRRIYRNSPKSQSGQHLDRLIASSIISLAQKHRAGSIVLPETKGLLERTEGKVRALAEQKVPDYKQGQEKFAKQHRKRYNRWNYARLLQTVQQQAAKLGISVELGRQISEGSSQEKARDIALAIYHSRQVVDA